MHICRRFSVLLAAVLAVWCCNASSQTLRPGSPEWLKRCQEWIGKKGYPVDYIEQKTGRRQEGFASAWKGNVLAQELRAGDVAILSLPNPDGRTVMGAAYVEAIEPAANGSEAFVVFSAMGLMVKQWIDQECFVGDTFGRVVHSRVPVSRVVRGWRLGMPLE